MAATGTRGEAGRTLCASLFWLKYGLDYFQLTPPVAINGKSVSRERKPPTAHSVKKVLRGASSPENGV